MLTINNAGNINLDDVQIDPYWNTGSERESKMHRIHAYPAKFPAFITTKALNYAKNKGLQVCSIADVFCGCGTTAYEARRNNMAFWGCDINPTATLIAKVKSHKYQINRLERYFAQIKVGYKEESPVNKYPVADERLKYWFNKDQYNDLHYLIRTIKKMTSPNSMYQHFFLCAFSNILKSTSMWLTKSIKPQFDPLKKPADVFSSFVSQCQFMIEACQEVGFESGSDSKIVTGNFLSRKSLPPKVDLIVTSPPYVISYEYADLHQLSSLWLNYSKDYRDLREGSIGSLFHDEISDLSFNDLNNTAKEIVFDLKRGQKRKARSVTKYFLDMQDVAHRTFDMLNSNGMAFFVIGNTEYKGVRVDNAKHLVESLLDAGFLNVQITKRKISKKILTPYRDQKGRFSTDSKGRKVYSEEFIVVGRR